MSIALAFDFSVNKENNTINVKREFDANLNLVWNAWTKPEILDLWWVPKPYQTKTKSMDFKEGGIWLYAMISLEGDTHWCRDDYKKIEPLEHFSGLDAFCDENGSINTTLPCSLWSNSFTANTDTTIVNIVISYETLADLEKITELGFKEGFTMALGNLDELLTSLKK